MRQFRRACTQIKRAKKEGGERKDQQFFEGARAWDRVRIGEVPLALNEREKGGCVGTRLTTSGDKGGGSWARFWLDFQDDSIAAIPEAGRLWMRHTHAKARVLFHIRTPRSSPTYWLTFQ